MYILWYSDIQSFTHAYVHTYASCRKVGCVEIVVHMVRVVLCIVVACVLYINRRAHERTCR